LAANFLGFDGALGDLARRRAIELDIFLDGRQLQSLIDSRRGSLSSAPTGCGAKRTDQGEEKHPRQNATKRKWHESDPRGLGVSEKEAWKRMF
jgi:hypothetical protein